MAEQYDEDQVREGTTEVTEEQLVRFLIDEHEVPEDRARLLIETNRQVVQQGIARGSHTYAVAEQLLEALSEAEDRSEES